MILKKNHFIAYFLTGVFFIFISSFVTPFAIIPSQPKYLTTTLPLHAAHDYFDKQHPLFWTLMPYYVGQRLPYSCAAASTVTVFNGLRALLKTPLNAADPLITEANLLATTAWKNMKNFNHGICLTDLKPLLQTLLQSFQIKAEVALHVADKSFDKKKLEGFLKETENAQSIILINFLQSTFTGDTAIGHYGVIGAFDQEHDQVLILDPDRDYYEPYWVSTQSLLEGMKTMDDQKKAPRGFLTFHPQKG